MKMCTYIFFLYSISHIGAFLALTEESTINAGLRPLTLGTDKNIPPEELSENEILTTHILKGIQAEANTLANLKNTEERAAVIFGRLRTHAITTAKCYETAVRYSDVLSELTAYKARSAQEIFEETYCFLRHAELEKESEELFAFYNKTALNASGEIMKNITEKVERNLGQKKIHALEFAEQIYVRILRWLWIFKNRPEGFEVNILLKKMKEKDMDRYEFSVNMAMGYYYLSRNLHNTVFSKTGGKFNKFVPQNLDQMPAVSDTLSVFMSIYDFSKPSRRKEM